MKESRKASRSKRRYNNRLSYAIDKRETLLDRQAFSAPAELGRTAIFYSRGVSVHDSRMDRFEEFEDFRREAHDLSETIGRDKSSVIEATKISMSEALADYEVSDVIVVGNGSIGSYWLNRCRSSGKVERYSWFDVSADARHLKSGKFIQRTCGGFNVNSDTVPLGAFAVADITNVIAPVGRYIDRVNPDETLLRPVFTEAGNLSGQITRLNQEYRQVISS